MRNVWAKDPLVKLVLACFSLAIDNWVHRIGFGLDKGTEVLASREETLRLGGEPSVDLAQS